MGVKSDFDNKRNALNRYLLSFVILSSFQESYNLLTILLGSQESVYVALPKDIAR